MHRLVAPPATRRRRPARRGTRCGVAGCRAPQELAAVLPRRTSGVVPRRIRYWYSTSRVTTVPDARPPRQHGRPRDAGSRAITMNNAFRIAEQQRLAHQQHQPSPAHWSCCARNVKNSIKSSSIVGRHIDYALGSKLRATDLRSRGRPGGPRCAGPRPRHLRLTSLGPTELQL